MPRGEGAVDASSPPSCAETGDKHRDDEHVPRVIPGTDEASSHGRRVKWYYRAAGLLPGRGLFGGHMLSAALNGDGQHTAYKRISAATTFWGKFGRFLNI